MDTNLPKLGSREEDEIRRKHSGNDCTHAREAVFPDNPVSKGSFSVPFPLLKLQLSPLGLPAPRKPRSRAAFLAPASRWRPTSTGRTQTSGRSCAAESLLRKVPLFLDGAATLGRRPNVANGPRLPGTKQVLESPTPAARLPLESRRALAQDLPSGSDPLAGPSEPREAGGDREPASAPPPCRPRRTGWGGSGSGGGAATRPRASRPRPERSGSSRGALGGPATGGRTSGGRSEGRPAPARPAPPRCGGQSRRPRRYDYQQQRRPRSKHVLTCGADAGRGAGGIGGCPARVPGAAPPPPGGSGVGRDRRRGRGSRARLGREPEAAPPHLAPRSR